MGAGVVTANRRAQYWLEKRTRKGFRDHPIATIAYYGPDHTIATKVAVGIAGEDDDIIALERWFSDKDVRSDPSIAQDIVDFIEQHSAKSVVTTDRIIGCPHEEGIDYPEGENCPQCPYWAGRDRWTGEPVK